MSDPGTDPREPRASGDVRVLIAAVALLLTALAFVNALPGDFVGDDDVQIVKNDYIQESRYFRKALTADVWAFAGERGEAWSNYWRPMFALWLVVNHRLFGLQPMGWHVTSIVLHCVVILLAGEVLRRLAVGTAVSAAVLWIFAVHPVHVESVTWISGSPDLLLASFLLGSLACHLAWRSNPRATTRIAALLLYGGATLCKEAAVVFPLLVFVVDWALARKGTGRVGRAGRAAAPFVAVAALWFGARLAVLGMLARSSPLGPTGVDLLLSLPQVVAFYLRQVFWPVTLSPLYPLRPLAPGAIDAMAMLPAVATVVVAAIGLALLWRRGALYKIGIAIFLLPLAPAMNLAVLDPERMVQDRYLYLPLLGILIVAVSAAEEIVRRLAADRGALAGRVVYVGALLTAVLLTLSTVRYNRVWMSDISHWEHAARINPDSAHSLGTLGYHYRRAGRVPEAIAVLGRAERLDPDEPQAQVDLGIIAADQRRYAEAERRFRQVISRVPDHEAALDRLGKVLLEQGRPEEALQVFLAARERLPYRRVKSTINIALTQASLNRPDLAAAELESVRDAMAERSDPQILLGFWHLAELYRQAGRGKQARAAYLEFLEATEGLEGALVQTHRAMARRRLASLRK